MKIHRILFFILVLNASLTFAQSEKKLKHILVTKDLAIILDQMHVDHVMHFKNEISPNYVEYSIEIKNDFNTGKNTGTSICYLVNLIAYKNEVIYYQLYNCENCFVNFKPLASLDSFINTAAYTTFLDAYANYYHTDKNKLELFDHDLIYGHCLGITGAIPDGKIAIDSLINLVDTNTIYQWLKSANTEKQLYALEAIRIFKYKKIFINSEILQIVEKLKTKQSSVYECHCCEISYFGQFSDRYKEIFSCPIRNLLVAGNDDYNLIYGRRLIKNHQLKANQKTNKTIYFSYAGLLFIILFLVSLMIKIKNHSLK